MENQLKTWKFKTNLQCGGCVSNVKPALDEATGIQHWEVDLQDPERTLIVQAKGITKEEILALIASRGFKAEPQESEE